MIRPSKREEHIARRPGKGGILLFEVLLALLILSIGITTALQGFQQTIALTKTVRAHFEARAAMNDIITQLLINPEQAAGRDGQRESVVIEGMPLHTELHYTITVADISLPDQLDEKLVPVTMRDETVYERVTTTVETAGKPAATVELFQAFVPET